MKAPEILTCMFNSLQQLFIDVFFGCIYVFLLSGEIGDHKVSQAPLSGGQFLVEEIVALLGDLEGERVTSFMRRPLR